MSPTTSQRWKDFTFFNDFFFSRSSSCREGREGLVSFSSHQTRLEWPRTFFLSSADKPCLLASFLVLISFSLTVSPPPSSLSASSFFLATERSTSAQASRREVRSFRATSARMARGEGALPVTRSEMLRRTVRYACETAGGGGGESVSWMCSGVGVVGDREGRLIGRSETCTGRLKEDVNAASAKRAWCLGVGRGSGRATDDKRLEVATGLSIIEQLAKSGTTARERRKELGGDVRVLGHDGEVGRKDLRVVSDQGREGLMASEQEKDIEPSSHSKMSKVARGERDGPGPIERCAAR